MISDEECKEIISLGRDWLEAATEVEQGIQSTAADLSENDDQQRSGIHAAFPKSVEGGIQPFYGSGHSSCAWRARLAVRPIFSALFETRDLITLPWTVSFYGQSHPKMRVGFMLTKILK